MSEASGYRVRELLPAEIQGLPGVLRNELQQAHPSGPLGLAWNFLGTTAAGKIAEALDLDLFEVLAQGWSVARELKEYTDPVKHPPGRRSVVYLGKHKFKTSVHPTLEISVDGLAKRELRFTLELTATFRSIALGIENGRILDAAAGDGDVSAQMKYGAAPLHTAVTSTPLKLPGRVTFKAPGLAIE